MRLLAAICLVAAALCLPPGLLLPVMELKRLVFLTDTPSIIDLVVGLWSAGDIVLAMIVVMVSVLFPAMKLVAVNVLLVRDHAHRHNGTLGTIVGILSKWSMLDVMLVALAIFAAKTSGLATAVSMPGLWFFTLSALLAACAATLAKRATTPHTDQP